MSQHEAISDLQRPLLPLRGMLLFPYAVVPLEVGRVKSVAALEHAMADHQQIILVAQKEAEEVDPGPDQLYKVGVLAKIKQLVSTPEGPMNVIVEGLKRVEVRSVDDTGPFYVARGVALEEQEADDDEAHVFLSTALRLLKEHERITRKRTGIDEKLLDQFTPGQAADIVAFQLPIALTRRQKLLETIDAQSRLESICHILEEEIQLATVERRIERRVRQQMERSQREFYLRERMKAIQKELGERDGRSAEVEELREKLNEAELPEEVEQKAEQELDRLSKMPPIAAEGVVVRTYLEWLAALPWSKRSTDRESLAEAEQILEEDHFGMKEAKERISEFIAVRRLKEKPKSPILCLVGPPGVGKTSLARSMARSLGREFERFSLGGVRDEAEIRGHRRTYIGAMPGRVLQALRRAGTKNPLILLDEIDKMTADYRGDPAASLLEVLDPEQNYAFSDHYLEVPFDLSECIFVTTANTTHSIPSALLDRMEVIRLGGYTFEEKHEIALRHLIPQAIADHGLEADQLHISDNALASVISDYTKEAGVRNLARQIARLCRKAVRQILSGRKKVRINIRTIESFLGPPPFRDDLPRQMNRVGSAHGLAYTTSGGGVLSIEVSVARGKGKLTLTGKLGEVMRESAQAAFSYIRAHAGMLGIDPAFYDTTDVHIHVPEGAVRKEGPSAGVTMAVALASALSGRAVRWDVGMTGEITLTGRVLRVGGIKDKLLAAHRSGLAHVVLPSGNKKDLEELPANVRQELTIHLVDDLEEVLHIGLISSQEDASDDVVPTELVYPLADGQQDWVGQDAG